MLVDTNVFVYALGAEHRYREPCRALVRRLGDGEIDGMVTATVITELAHQRLRQSGDREEAAGRARQVAAICRVLPTDGADARLALDLHARVPELDAFDALLAAVALNRGVGTIASAARAFDAVPGLVRLDPAS